MPSPLSPAVLILSFCAEAPEGDSADCLALDEVVPALARLLADHRLAATWASRGPANWPHTACLACQPRQEIALAIGQRGLARTDRHTTDEEVRRKILGARAGGINISTLFVDDSSRCERHDLLAKYGVTAICSTDEVGRGSASATRLGAVGRLLSPLATRTLIGPQKIRWGLWKIPPAIGFAAQGARRTRRALDRAAASGELTHLHCDLPAMASGGRVDLAPIDSLLRQIAQYEHSGRMLTQTVTETAACLSRPRGAVSACSILRKRAA
jgi:hypothetical protein